MLELIYQTARTRRLETLLKCIPLGTPKPFSSVKEVYHGYIEVSITDTALRS